MRILGGLILFLSVTSAWAQQAPFCAVTGLGSQCHYYSLSACQQAVRGMDGACVANLQQPQQQVQVQPIQSPRKPYDINSAIQYPDIIQSSIRAGEAGARQRQAEQEHQAKMRLLEAQLQAQQQQQYAPPTGVAINANNGYRVVYRCVGQDGMTLFSTVPAVGCIVLSVTAP